MRDATPSGLRRVNGAGDGDGLGAGDGCGFSPGATHCAGDADGCSEGANGKGDEVRTRVAGHFFYTDYAEVGDRIVMFVRATVACVYRSSVIIADA